MNVLGVVLSILIAQLAPAQRVPPASLQGVVVRAGGEPVSKAKVELRLTGASTSVIAVSDERGRFAFPEVEPGQYRLIASRSGYVVGVYGQAFPGGPGLTVKLARGQRAEDVRIALTAGGVIAGRVLDRGKPAANATVTAVKASYEVGQRVPADSLSAVTNDLGEYHIFWLAPGRYFIQASINDGPPTVLVKTSNGDNDSNLRIVPQTRLVFTRDITNVSDTEMHVPMYYPGTPHFRDARAIDVAAGSLIRDIDVQVATVPALHVRGVISGFRTPTGPAGGRGSNGPRANNPITANVVMLPVDATDVSPIARGYAGVDGSFDIPRVKPGSYVLQAASGNVRASLPVDVLDRDINGVRLELVPGLSISGRVVVEGDAPATALRISLLPDPVLGGYRENRGSAIPGTALTLSPDGSFTSPQILSAGDYRVLVVPLLSATAGLPAAMSSTTIPPPLAGAYVKSIRLGDTDVLRDGLRLSGNPRDPLLIVIGTNGSVIDGRVANREGRVATAATVALIPESSLRFRVAHKYAVTDIDGKFQVQGIAPGDYKLFAWEQVEQDAWQDPDFMRDYASSGKLVHIAEGSKASMELVSIPR